MTWIQDPQYRCHEEAQHLGVDDDSVFKNTITGLFSG